MAVAFAPFKISTITATACIGSEVNLDLLFHHTSIISYDLALKSKDAVGFIYMEHGKKTEDLVYRGFCKRLTITHRKKEKGKRFDKQVTAVIKVGDLCPRSINENDSQSMVNIKIFKNGNVQMTGIRCLNHGYIAVDMLINTLKELYAKDIYAAENPDKLEMSDFKIRLINSDFRTQFELKRDALCKIIQSKGCFCSFEPCIYPGVKVQYYYNELLNKSDDGICKCTVNCSGKGCGCGNGHCKMITIAIFQSGCVIITGAQTYDQISTAYQFICDIFNDHMSVIKRETIINLKNDFTKAVTNRFRRCVNI